MFKTFATAALALSFATAAMGEEKKNASFLAAPKESQTGYISTSLSMAQTLLSKSQGQCIGRWAETIRADAYNQVIDTIKKHDTFHPQSVIAAMMEKTCGKFELANN